MWLNRVLRTPLAYGIIAIGACALVALLIHGSARVSSLLASSASTLTDAPAVIYFAPYEEGDLPVGTTVDVDVRINSSKPINAIGATVHFPMDMIEIVGISKKTSFFDLWTEETTIKENTGDVHFSGGTTKMGGHTGVGTILTLSVKVKKAGRAELSITDADIFASDGRGTALPHDERSYTYTVVDVSPVAIARDVEVATPSRPSPDLNNDGAVTLADLSILAIQLLAPYNGRYDLDLNGSIGLSDISILFASIRR